MILLPNGVGESIMDIEERSVAIGSEYPFEESAPATAFKSVVSSLVARVGFGEDGDRSSTVDRLSEQFARHEAFLETGGTQACKKVEIVEVGDLADEEVQVTCEGHPVCPGAGDGKVLQEREEFERMRAVGLDTVPVRCFGRVQLPVAADDDLPRA